MNSFPYFLITFVQTFVDIMSVLIIVRVLMSWFMATGRRAPGRLTQIVYDVTEPVIKIAKKVPHRIGMIDLSPIIALIGLDLAGYFFILLLRGL
ncbi:MAG: YggT family protein [Patescibacteria group bacterium]|nr:YggT family protein [Patescibacteria group bacterium]